MKDLYISENLVQNKNLIIIYYYFCSTSGSPVFVNMYVKLNLSKKGNNSHLPRIKLKLACNCRGLHKSMRRLAVKVNVNKI